MSKEGFKPNREGVRTLTQRKTAELRVRINARLHDEQSDLKDELAVRGINLLNRIHLKDKGFEEAKKKFVDRLHEKYVMAETPVIATNEKDTQVQLADSSVADQSPLASITELDPGRGKESESIGRTLNRRISHSSSSRKPRTGIRVAVFGAAASIAAVGGGAVYASATSNVERPSFAATATANTKLIDATTPTDPAVIALEARVTADEAVMKAEGDTITALQSEITQLQQQDGAKLDAVMTQLAAETAQLTAAEAHKCKPNCQCGKNAVAPAPAAPQPSRVGKIVQPVRAVAQRVVQKVTQVTQVEVLLSVTVQNVNNNPVTVVQEAPPPPAEQPPKKEVEPPPTPDHEEHPEKPTPPVKVKGKNCLPDQQKDQGKNQEKKTLVHSIFHHGQGNQGARANV